MKKETQGTWRKELRKSYRKSLKSLPKRRNIEKCRRYGRVRERERVRKEYDEENLRWGRKKNGRLLSRSNERERKTKNKQKVEKRLTERKKRRLYQLKYKLPKTSHGLFDFLPCRSLSPTHTLSHTHTHTHTHTLTLACTHSHTLFLFHQTSHSVFFSWSQKPSPPFYSSSRF